MPKFPARMEYLKAIYVRYRKASKDAKSRILDEFCRVCDYNRKYAVRLLNGPAPGEGPQRITRRRPFHYSLATLQAAQMIWKASGYLCGQRLKQAIPLWLPATRQRLKLSAETERQLLSISARQLDERLKPYKQTLKRRFYTQTRPGRLLKSMIPIRTFNADITQPGFLEIDLVAHCGNSSYGDFIYTLTATDVFTGWTDRMAVLGKGQNGIVDALRTLQARLPFRLRAIDSDNGEEFINHHLLRFCRGGRPQIAFTRSRVGKKNDNPHVEQKNWTHVRALLGWQRFDSLQALEALNALYAKELLCFQNLFQPSVRLVEKTHLGSKILRRYQEPRTPLDRLKATGLFHRQKFNALERFRAAVDPFALSEIIDRKLQALARLANPCPPHPLHRAPLPHQIMPSFTRRNRLQDRMMTKAIDGTYAKTLKERSKTSVTF